MRIMIDISEETYKMACSGYPNKDGLVELFSAIESGTKLPKGHGKLKDVTKIYNQIDALNRQEKYKGRYTAVLALIDFVETIIEADTTRDCKTCGHSNNGKCAGTEECHDCMWESKYIEVDKGEQE